MLEDDFMHLEPHKRPRMNQYGMIARIAELPEGGIIFLYGCQILGGGVGNRFFAPEYNGIVIISTVGSVLLKDYERTGFMIDYEPTKKQLWAYDCIREMSEVERAAWLLGKPDSINLLRPKRCPKCSTPLECDVSYVFKGMPLLENMGGGLEWDEDQANSRDAVDFDYIYCPQCDEEVELEAED